VNLGGGTTSGTSIHQQLQAYRQQRAADLAQAGQDLQAGNLTAAQTDINTLIALGQTGPNKNGQTFQRADRAQDFRAIGQALQSGNLADAQSAYASLAGSFGQQNQQAQNAIPAYNSNPAEIVINIGAPSTGTTASAPSAIPSPTSTTPALQPPTTTSTGSNLPEIVINGWRSVLDRVFNRLNNRSWSSTSTRAVLPLRIQKTSQLVSAAIRGRRFRSHRFRNKMAHPPNRSRSIWASLVEERNCRSIQIREQTAARPTRSPSISTRRRTTSSS
jgi:hypothetical protein